MKKKIALLIVLTLFVSVVFSGCGEEFGVQKADIKYKIQDGAAIVTELPNKTDVTEIQIPDEYENLPVTEIADFAGCNLESVVKISIGKNVEEIGAWAFENNQSLKEFSVDENNEHFCSKDGVLYTKDMTSIVFYPPAGATECTIPEGVQSISTKAFYKCDKITSITLPSTLMDIETQAFFKCSSLEKIDLPDKLIYIGKDAFSYCEGLTEITIPATTEYIGEYAFFNCRSLKTVNMECKKDFVKLRTKWQPTDNGIEMKDLKINWK